MTSGVLLDSSPLYWLDEGTALRPSALQDIAAAQARQVLFVSDISVWELGTARHKKQVERRPNLRGLPPDVWFLEVMKTIKAKSLRIDFEVALEAGNVPAHYGYGDPGDCFLIATARVHGLALVTRDERILDLAARQPDYLTVIPC